jgi:5-methylcytosine-specific restriction endonuclease McrA
MFFENGTASEQEIKKEKEKARHLRQTDWWLQRANKGVCHYCNRTVGRENLTMDHIVPLSRGGKSKKGNIVPACKDCNNKKRYLLPIEWAEYLEKVSGSSASSPKAL